MEQDMTAQYRKDLDNAIDAGSRGRALPDKASEDIGLNKAYIGALEKYEEKLLSVSSEIYERSDRGKASPDEIARADHIQTRVIAEIGQRMSEANLNLRDLESGRMPASWVEKQADAAMERERSVQGLEVSREVRDALPKAEYSGVIVKMDERSVLQRPFDQPSTLVRHDKAALSGQYELNQAVSINYPHGRAGLVREADRQIQAGDRDRDHGKHDKQHQVERER